MQITKERLREYIDNPSHEIDSLLDFDYEKLDFELLNTWVDARLEIESKIEGISDYLLCLSILCKDSDWLKIELKKKKLISNFFDENLLKYLTTRFTQNWCKYKDLGLILAYGKHWEFFKYAESILDKTFMLYDNSVNLNRKPSTTILSRLLSYKQNILIIDAFNYKLLHSCNKFDREKQVILYLDATQGGTLLLDMFRYNLIHKEDLRTNIHDKTILQTAIKNKRWAYIETLLNENIITKYENLHNKEHELQSDSQEEYNTILNLIAESGDIKIILEFREKFDIQVEEVRKLSGKYIEENIICNGYINTAYNLAINYNSEQILFNPSKKINNLNQNMWHIIANTELPKGFVDGNMFNIHEEHQNILITAIETKMCNINARDKNGLTILHFLAIRRNYETLIEIIRKFKVKIISDKYEEDLGCHLAAAGYYDEICEFIENKLLTQTYDKKTIWDYFFYSEPGNRDENIFLTDKILIARAKVIKDCKISIHNLCFDQIYRNFIISSFYENDKSAFSCLDYKLCFYELIKSESAYLTYAILLGCKNTFPNNGKYPENLYKYIIYQFQQKPINKLFLTIFFHNIEADLLINTIKSIGGNNTHAASIELLEKFINYAPSNDDHYMTVLGYTIIEFYKQNLHGIYSGNIPRIIENYVNTYPHIFASGSQHNLNSSFRTIFKDFNFRGSCNNLRDNIQGYNSSITLFTNRTNLHLSQLTLSDDDVDNKKQEHANRLSMSS